MGEFSPIKSSDLNIQEIFVHHQLCFQYWLLIKSIKLSETLLELIMGAKEMFQCLRAVVPL